MTGRLTLLGTPLSPFVRKIIAILDLKGIEFDIDPIVAFFTGEAFLKINPLRRIPVLIDGDQVIADSSVIAAYLEEKFSTPPILPATPAARARARWLEEFADTRMADIFLWRCFNAVVVKPSVWGEERNVEAYKEALAGPVPEIMDYLEGLAPDHGWLDDEIGLGDISIAAMFLNMRVARWEPDAGRWPRAAAWIARTEQSPAFARANAWAEALLTTPIPAQRDRAREIGLPLTESTFFESGTPRRGPMTVAL